MKNSKIYGEIYTITSKLDGKNNVGQTTVGVENRLKQHKWQSKHIKKSGCRALYNAVRRHGWDNFECRTLETILSTGNNAKDQEILNKKEEFWISSAGLDSHVSNGKGYNLTYGGSRGKHAEESKKRMSNSQQALFTSKRGTILKNNISKRQVEWFKTDSGKTQRILMQKGHTELSRKKNALSHGILSEKYILEIHDLLKSNIYTQNELAKMYNISQSTISCIKLNKIWKYLNLSSLRGPRKLIEKDVLEIYDLLKSKIFTHKEISIWYNVKRATITKISRGILWKRLNLKPI